jgi:hypothetical protein
VALGEQQRQSVEQQIRRARGFHGRMRRTRRLGRVQNTEATAETAGEQGRRQGVEVGLARQRHIERREPVGGLEQQRRSVAAAVGGERDLGPQQLHPRTLELVERPGLRGRD